MLRDFAGNFNLYVKGRDLTKQEGLVFRHLLRLILLCGEFAQVCPAGLAAEDWRAYLRDLLEVRADDIGPDLVAGFRHVLPVRDEQVWARHLVGAEHRFFHADVRDVFAACGDTA